MMWPLSPRTLPGDVSNTQVRGKKGGREERETEKDRALMDGPDHYEKNNASEEENEKKT